MTKKQQWYTVEYDAPIGDGKTVKNWYGRWPTQHEAALWLAKQSKPEAFKIVPAK